MFYAGFFWKANLWRQAFLESKFEEAGWSSNSPKKYSNNLLKTFQNLSKIVPKRRLGMVLSDLGASGGDLGASWSILGASWGRLGASWARLGSLKSRCEMR